MTTYATINDFLDELRSLSSRDMRALAAYANRLIGGTPFSSPLDLLHEAIDRTLAGQRRWPVGLDLRVYLAQACRSISNGARKRLEAKNLSFEAQMELHGDGFMRETGISAEEAAILRESVVEARRALDAASVALERDHEARAVLEALAEGVEPAAAREALGLDPLAYRAARERVASRLRSLGARGDR